MTRMSTKQGIKLFRGQDADEHGDDGAEQRARVAG